MAANEVYAARIKSLEAALDAPDVTPDDVPTLLQHALCRGLRGSMVEDREIIFADAQDTQARLEAICRALVGCPETPEERRLRARIHELSLEDSIMTMALGRLWDLRHKQAMTGATDPPR